MTDEDEPQDEDEYLEATQYIDEDEDEVDEDKICFSYTPIDNFHVHNANLFSASALFMISLLLYF
jgi:hypothetical protein